MEFFCITWAIFSRRMDEIAAEIGGKRWDCSVLFRVKFLAPIRYLVTAVKTILKLIKEKPNVVIAQNPPTFLPLVCWLYCLFSKCNLIIDHHCIWSEKTIRYPVLKDFIASIEKFVARRARVNISPNEAWTRKLRKFGKVNALTVIDYVEKVDAKKVPRDRFCKTKYLAVCPCGGHPDERPDLAIEAVKQLDDVTLVITGKKKYLKRFLPLEETNVIFSGFLPNEEYFGLLREADFTLNITDEVNTIPHFIYEFVALGKPVISSSDEAITSTFGDCVYIVKKNEAEAVKAAIKDLLVNLDLWTNKIHLLHRKLKTKRLIQMEALMREIGAF